MKQFICSILLLLVSQLAFAQLPMFPVDSLQETDLIFVVNTNGDAITSVTQGINNYPIDHVAIFCKINQHPSVLQAVPAYGVEISPLVDFVDESKPDSAHSATLLVARIMTNYDINQSLRKALGFVGLPYAYYFSSSDDRIYCSELVQKSYVYPNGQLVFSPIPMEFRDKDGKIPDFWVQYYAKKGLQVPEGAPGSNPGELSRRSQVTILGQLANQ